MANNTTPSQPDPQRSGEPEPPPGQPSAYNGPVGQNARQVIQGDNSTYIEAHPVGALDVLPTFSSAFAGREDERKFLETGVKFGEAFYLWGMPGVGKTALAAEFAKAGKDRFKGGVLYLDLDPERYEKSIGKVRAELDMKLNRPLRLDTDTLALLPQALALFPHSLLILDNAHADADRRIEILHGIRSEVAYLVVGQQHFGVEKEQQRELKPTNSADGKLIFEAYCARWGVAVPLNDAERGEERELIKYCSGLPLAFKLVAQLLADPDRSGFGRGLLKSLERELPKIEGEGGSETSRERNLAAAFNLSFARLKDERLRLFYTRLSRYPGSFEAAEAVSWALTPRPRRLLGFRFKENLARWYGPADPQARPDPDLLPEAAQLLKKLFELALLEEDYLSPSDHDREGQPTYTFHNLLRVFALAKLAEQNQAVTKSAALSPQVQEQEYHFLVARAQVAVRAASLHRAASLYRGGRLS